MKFPEPEVIALELFELYSAFLGNTVAGLCGSVTFPNCLHQHYFDLNNNFFFTSDFLSEPSVMCPY